MFCEVSIFFSFKFLDFTLWELIWRSQKLAYLSVILLGSKLFFFNLMGIDSADLDQISEIVKSANGNTTK